MQGTSPITTGQSAETNQPQSTEAEVSSLLNSAEGLVRDIRTEKKGKGDIVLLINEQPIELHEFLSKTEAKLIDESNHNPEELRRTNDQLSAALEQVKKTKKKRPFGYSVGHEMSGLIKREDAVTNNSLNALLDEGDVLVKVMNLSRETSESIKRAIKAIDSDTYDPETLWENINNIKTQFDQTQEQHPELMKNFPSPFGDDFTKDKVVSTSGYISKNYTEAKSNLESISGRINSAISFAQSKLPSVEIKLQRVMQLQLLRLKILHSAVVRCIEADRHSVRQQRAAGG